MTRRRFQIIRWIVASIPLITVLVSAYLTYQQSGSWRFAMTTAGIVALTLIGFMVLTRFGGAGLNVLSPNSVKRFDDHGHALQIHYVQWQGLSLTDVERTLLADWIQRHPPTWLVRTH